MIIREDFRSVETWLLRLESYAAAFAQNNVSDWSHLKNQEDFDRVYSLPASQRSKFEAIYMTGRDLAVAMSSRLTEFNWIQKFPSLKSFVDSFSHGWVNQIDLLEAEAATAEAEAAQLSNCPWSVSQMIKLYRAQISLLGHVAQCLEALRKSDLYIAESGLMQSSPKAMKYDAVLQCIHSVGKMFERLPATYLNKDEETLRDHMLVSLEAAVGGSVTGETFNKRGKTDILVRNEGNTCFVGECKFWAGSAGFQSTIDQLLSYLSWRDTNTALIFFVKNKEFTSIISKADEAARTHRLCIKKLGSSDETWSRFEFSHPDDPQRIIKVAVMLYHLP